MELLIQVGQVWKRKGKGFNQRICVEAINKKSKVVWVNGLGEMVEPIVTYEYLATVFEPEAGWEASSAFGIYVTGDVPA